MSKKCYRFFGGLLTAQEHWLNKMSEKGYRLIRAEKMLYEFEACKPDQVKYCVEFIGQKSKADASDYHEFLEGISAVSFTSKVDATILMVTHDAFWASYANRILFLRDGAIFAEILKGSDSRRVFFEKILNVLTMMGGGVNDVRYQQK